MKRFQDFRSLFGAILFVFVATNSNVLAQTTTVRLNMATTRIIYDVQMGDYLQKIRLRYGNLINYGTKDSVRMGYESGNYFLDSGVNGKMYQYFIRSSSDTLMILPVDRDLLTGGIANRLYLFQQDDVWLAMEVYNKTAGPFYFPLNSQDPRKEFYVLLQRLERWKIVKGVKK